MVIKQEKDNASGYTSINRLGLMTIIIALLIICFVFFLFYSYEKKLGEKQLVKDGVALCSLFTDVARQELFINQENKNLNLLDYVVREKEFLYCLIVDNDQTPLLQLGRSVPEPNATQSLNTDYLTTLRYKDNNTHEIIYEFSKPVYIKGQKAGLVRIGLGLSNYLNLNRKFGFMGGIAFLIFGLVFIFYYLVRKLLQPLFIINQDLAKMIMDKEECPKIDISPGGEIGQLVHKMNQLLTYQQSKNQKLEDSNLEFEVVNKILHYEKSRLRAILDNLKIGLIFIDATGKAVLANQLASLLLKADAQDYLGKPWEEFLQNQSPELFKLFYEFRQKENIYGHDFLEIMVANSGTSILICHACFYLLDAEDTPLGFLWTITDITSQKQAELSRYEFVNHVAHELKTPLNTLRSYTEMLLDNEVEDEQNRREFFNNINEETIRLSRLINNLLNISKIEMGCLKINQTLIKVDKLIKDCYQTVHPQAMNKGLDFICDIADKMPNLLLDKDLIEVAILNLLTNAIKYTPESGKVVLKGLVEEDQVMVRVTDSGYGITENELNHIFDKFFRSSREEIIREAGTGLGLALAKNIVQLHKGEIRVESKVGSGSSFTIILPREEVYI